jgi:hypothetical protein
MGDEIHAMLPQQRPNLNRASPPIFVAPNQRIDLFF